jgi:GntR family transcriptional regulator
MRITRRTRSHPVPLEPPRSQYRQLADLLRGAIERGDYPPGSVLPSEPELSQRYGVSRPTINRAVSILRAQGLVRVDRGRGTIVREIPVIRRAAVTRYERSERERADSRGAFDAEIRGLGMTPRSDVEVSRAVPPPEVARALRLPEGEQNVIVRRRRMYANDVPVQLAPSYIPAEIAAGTRLAEPDPGPGGIISRFAELGYAQARITETVRVRAASDEERQFLRLDADQAVIEIWHVGWTAAGRPVEVCVHSMPAYLWTLDYEWPTA